MAQPQDLQPDQLKPDKLRKLYPQFTYLSSVWKLIENDVALEFAYTIGPDIRFSHSVVFRNVPQERVAQLPASLLDRLAFSLGLITAFSYWKTTASPHFVVEAGSLSPEEITWWHELLLAGMGEFFFVNNLDFTQEGFVEIISSGAGAESDASLSAPALNLSKSFLIPVGGGKDSAVTLEIMKKHLPVESLGTLLFQAPEAAHTMAQISAIPNSVVIYRTFDTKLSELNQLGFLNGHTPFSAMLAFASTLAAVLYGYSQIVLSNEASANEGNVVFHNQTINHQYSKTFAFETAFESYLAQHLFPEYSPADRPTYFSLMRPLSELQIGSLFAKLTQYHEHFRSCNRGQQTNTWCTECSKCLFAYLILFPFLSWGSPEKLFGENLFAKLSLLEEAKELLGKGEKKPLECVGTLEECLVAAYLSKKQYDDHAEALPPLLAWIDQEVLSTETDLEQRASTLMQSWNSEHGVPEELVIKLLRY